jgi:TRAP-type C4-dicarboxylate transport system permease large subunit
MPSIPITVLLVPIVFPTVLALGYDPIWFGVIVVLMNEIGALTPPVGINVFAVAGIAKHIPISTIFRGVGPFLLALLVLTILLVAFPQIALFLPTIMKGV